MLPQQLTKLKKVAVVGPLAGCKPPLPLLRPLFPRNPITGDVSERVIAVAGKTGAAQPCEAQSAMAGGYNPDPATAQIVTVVDALTARLGALVHKHSAIIIIFQGSL